MASEKLPYLIPRYLLLSSNLQNEGVDEKLLLYLKLFMRGRNRYRNTILDDIIGKCTLCLLKRVRIKLMKELWKEGCWYMCFCMLVCLSVCLCLCISTFFKRIFAFCHNLHYSYLTVWSICILKWKFLSTTLWTWWNPHLSFHKFK